MSPRPSPPSNGKAKWPDNIDGCADDLPNTSIIMGIAEAADTTCLTKSASGGGNSLGDAKSFFRYEICSKNLNPPNPPFLKGGS